MTSDTRRDGTDGSGTRALVLRSSAERAPDSAPPSAAFIVQLIACERRLPGYRVARQAEPEAAHRNYARPAGSTEARLNVSV